ncbi:hypothetical protein [Ascidiimonas sp. W6]|uniref:hypothetical protein n=1 Tax=Ascidiimonas meishanensis TaxID=3128903 RepID=UPI0030EE8985
MRKTDLLVLILVFLTSCQGITKDDVVTNISGYWEIKEVKLKDGTLKEYKISTTIDFIKMLDSTKGFRKKLQPNLIGKFYGSDDVEQFTILEMDNSFWLQYATNLTKWKERILEIEENLLVVENENGITYYYKRFKPINVSE